MKNQYALQPAKVIKVVKENSITNTWVRDVYSKNQFGIPNFMTGRVLNFKLAKKTE